MTTFGGNSGYVGYSISKRGHQAKKEGRYPKTQLCKEYGISPRDFNEALDLGIVSRSEWHHTSKFGNRTEFYELEDELIAFLVLVNEKKYKDLLDYFEGSDQEFAEYIRDAKYWIGRRYNNEVELLKNLSKTLSECPESSPWHETYKEDVARQTEKVKKLRRI